MLKNLVRDWSDEGAQERKLTYGRILGELRERFKDWCVSLCLLRLFKSPISFATSSVALNLAFMT